MGIAEKIRKIESRYIRKDLPNLEVGDVVKMRVKVKEADKVRVHPYEGTVIKKSGGGINAYFTIRKISFGEGVERTFPAHSPMIESLDIISKGRVKRAKLYYLRGRVGKRARIQKVISQ